MWALGMALIPISLDDMSSVLDLILTCCGQVDVGMALIHIGLDELSSILEVDAWMRLTWTDEYLTWNKSDYDGKGV